jgi:tetratricopeptide (TPR) repeat protein
MKYLILSILLLFSFSTNDGSLAAARSAYEQGDYTTSIKHFRQAARDFPEKSSQIRYNIAQCYAAMDSISLAQLYYEQASRSGDNALAARALNNMGEILAQQNQLDQALKLLRNALYRNPQDEKARYNYELVSRRQQMNAPERDSDSEESDQSDSQTDNHSPSTRPEIYNQLPQLSSQAIPGDEAQAFPFDTLALSGAQRLLENMRQRDIRFVQQLPKRYILPEGKRDAERPDW